MVVGVVYLTTPAGTLTRIAVKTITQAKSTASYIPNCMARIPKFEKVANLAIQVRECEEIVSIPGTVSRGVPALM